MLDVKPIIDILSNWSLLFLFCILTLSGLIRVTQALLREVFPRKDSFLTGHIDIQVASMNACKNLKVQALRVNTALFRDDFVKAIHGIEKIDFLFLRPFDQPRTDWEIDHNKKLELTMRKLDEDIIPEAQKKNHTISVRFIDEVPTKNVFIYDDKVAHIKQYNKKSNSCESSPISIHSIERDSRSFAKVLQQFYTTSASSIDSADFYKNE